jgi:hypothetical protein
MKDQHLTTIDFRKNILGSARQPDNRLSFETRGKLFRQWKSEVRPALLNAGKGRADERGFQPAPDNLNLGKFRHYRSRRAPRSSFASLSTVPANMLKGFQTA